MFVLLMVIRLMPPVPVIPLLLTLQPGVVPIPLVPLVKPTTIPLIFAVIPAVVVTMIAVVHSLAIPVTIALMFFFPLLGIRDGPGVSQQGKRCCKSGSQQP